RVDYQMTQNHTMTARYSYNRSDRQNSGIGAYSLLSRAFSGESSNHELQVSETAVISPSLATETRFQYAKSDDRSYGDISTPAINVDGAFNAGSNQVGDAFGRYRRYDLQNISTYVRGTHAVRFGARYVRRSNEENSPSNFGGTFTFQGVGNAPALDANNQPLPN